MFEACRSDAINENPNYIKSWERMRLLIQSSIHSPIHLLSPVIHRLPRHLVIHLGDVRRWQSNHPTCLMTTCSLAIRLHLKSVPDDVVPQYVEFSTQGVRDSRRQSLPSQLMRTSTDCPGSYVISSKNLFLPTTIWACQRKILFESQPNLKTSKGRQPAIARRKRTPSPRDKTRCQKVLSTLFFSTRKEREPKKSREKSTRGECQLSRD